MTSANDHIVECDSEAARLLPWLVADRIEPADAARVEAHLATCPACRADFAEQRELRVLMQSDDRVEYSPQPSLQKLMSRIDELDRELPTEEASPTGGAAVAPPAKASPARWLMAAVVLQTIGLALLGSLLWGRSGTGVPLHQYETLTSVPAKLDTTARLRVVFAPGATMSGVAELLGAIQADIVAGPSESGAYTLALKSGAAAPPAIDSRLARLRSDSRILFAEPVVGATGPPR